MLYLTHIRLLTQPFPTFILPTDIMSESSVSPELTEQQRENLRRIVLIARCYNARNIREADPGAAIAITERVYQSEKYFRDHGVNLDP